LPELPYPAGGQIGQLCAERDGIDALRGTVVKEDPFRLVRENKTGMNS
jgi:hypothetical protein